MFRSYEETECMCYLPDESSNILQMKTTFKKAKPRNKLGLNTHSHFHCTSTNYNYNDYEKLQHSCKDYNILPPCLEDKYYLLHLQICNKNCHKTFQCRNKKQKDFCQNIKTYSKGQTYFFILGYDIGSNKSNLLVDCEATDHVITDKSKFTNFDPGNHFVN